MLLLKLSISLAEHIYTPPEPAFGPFPSGSAGVQVLGIDKTFFSSHLSVCTSSCVFPMWVMWVYPTCYIRLASQWSITDKKMQLDWFRIGSDSQMSQYQSGSGTGRVSYILVFAIIPNDVLFLSEDCKYMILQAWFHNKNQWNIPLL